jgi:hypothetical protein
LQKLFDVIDNLIFQYFFGRNSDREYEEAGGIGHF